MRGALSLGVVAVGALVAAACGGTTTVRGPVVHPATVPVRSFPRIWVARGDLAQERTLAETLAHHLSEGGEAEVRVLELGDLEPLRVQERIPPATVVIVTDIRFRERVESRFTSRPETMCGTAGCYTTQRSYSYEVPMLDATLALVVHDGPSAQVLQRVTVSADEEGREFEIMRNRAAEVLARKAKALVDQRIELVEVALLDVEAPRVREAIDTISAGHWADGRQLLERVATSEEVAALPPEERARLLYDLGQARRFDPTTLRDPPRHFAAAAQALREAMRLAPEERYERALADVVADRERFALVQQQNAAAEFNYRVGRGIPEPPPSYAQPQPATPTPPPETPPETQEGTPDADAGAPGPSRSEPP